MFNSIIVANGKGRKVSKDFDGSVFNIRGEEKGVKVGNSSDVYSGNFAVSKYVNGKVVATFEIVNAG